MSQGDDTRGTVVLCQRLGHFDQHFGATRREEGPEGWKNKVVSIEFFIMESNGQYLAEIANLLDEGVAEPW